LHGLFRHSVRPQQAERSQHYVHSNPSPHLRRFAHRGCCRRRYRRRGRRHRRAYRSRWVRQGGGRGADGCGRIVGRVPDPLDRHGRGLRCGRSQADHGRRRLRTGFDRYVGREAPAICERLGECGGVGCPAFARWLRRGKRVSRVAGGGREGVGAAWRVAHQSQIADPESKMDQACPRGYR